MSPVIKDKEIPRWRPLRRLSIFAPAKLSPKRILLLVAALACLFLLLAPSYIRPATILEAAGGDDEVISGHRSRVGLTSMLNLRKQSNGGKPMALFVTSHDLDEVVGLMEIACEMAAAGSLPVFLLFLGRNSKGSVRLFFRANKWDRKTCPLIYYDGRHQYSSFMEQLSASEDQLRETIMKLDPLLVFHLDGEEDWFMQSLERVVGWQSQIARLIQLKRSALPNLRWIATLSYISLACIFAQNSANSSLECSQDRYCNHCISVKYWNSISTNRISP
jgi:hypothetical protein